MDQLESCAWSKTLCQGSRRIVPGSGSVSSASIMESFHADAESRWDKKGGSQNSSVEMRAIMDVFDEAGTPIEVRSTFTNSKRFTANHIRH